MPSRETRSQVGLVAAVSRPRFPGPLKGVTAHYNGPAMGMRGEPHAECQRRWRGIQRFHMGSNHPNPTNGRDWSDTAYTFAVCHHEVAMDGRGEGVRTAANGTSDGNNSWYACFFMIGEGEEPSPEMLRASDWYASNHLGTDTWNKHSDHKSTSCPGSVGNYISGGDIDIGEEGFLMALSDEEQETLRDDVVKIKVALGDLVPLIKRTDDKVVKTNHAVGDLHAFVQDLAAGVDVEMAAKRMLDRIKARQEG